MITAPEAVARTSTRSPGLMPTASRTFFGSVTCPFTVTVVVMKGSGITRATWYYQNGSPSTGSDLSCRANAGGALLQIGGEGANVVVVLGKERAEIVLLGDRQIESGYHDIDNAVPAAAAINAEIHFDRLLA